MAPYSPTAWLNNSPPPLSAANLNKLTDELEAQAAAKSISHSLPTWADGVAPALTDAAPLNEMERVASAVAASLSLSYTPTSWSSGWTPSRNATRFNRLEQQAQTNRAALDAGTGTPTHRFATFDISTDKIGGTLNRFNYPSNSYWWVPGSPEPPSLPGATLWAQGGGIFPISTAFGPGFDLVCDPDMVYQGAGDSRVVRLWVHPSQQYLAASPIPFLNTTHVWEWTWMRPTAGNPSGWPSGVFLEGFNFGNTISGVASVGHHFYLDNNWQQAGPMHYYAGRQTSVNTWQRYHCPYPFNADEYHSIKWEIRWSFGLDGYMRASTDLGLGYVQWLNFSGPTLPGGWDENIYQIAHDIRPPLVGPTNTIKIINWRLTLP